MGTILLIYHHGLFYVSCFRHNIGLCPPSPLLTSVICTEYTLKFKELNPAQNQPVLLIFPIKKYHKIHYVLKKHHNKTWRAARKGKTPRFFTEKFACFFSENPKRHWSFTVLIKNSKNIHIQI